MSRHRQDGKWRMDSITGMTTGVMARDKEVYDPDSDEWHWFDADGTMARDKDVFIPTNAERTEGNGYAMMRTVIW